MTELSFYWQSVITTFALGTLLAVAVLSWILAAMMPGIDRWNRRFFIWFFFHRNFKHWFFTKYIKYIIIS